MRKILLLLAMFMGFSFLAFSQTRTVSGTVKDQTGNPVPNASVTVKGISVGAITDENGDFSLQVSANSNTLIISAIGYKDHAAQISGNDPVNVTLSLVEDAMDEVIVTGYSTTTKRSFTGSAANIDMGNLERKNVSNLSQALAGEVAGVRVINTSGQPGSSATIRIRGFGSVNGSRDPLYVLDGVPFTGNLNALNMADMESVTVLKDAAATAIYGARGANGVVLLTTKSGRGKKSYIEVDGRIGSNFRALPRYNTIKSPEEYIGLSWESMYNYAQTMIDAGDEGFEGVDPTTWANENLFGDNGIDPNFNIWNVTSIDQLIDPTTRKVKSGVTRKYTPENWEDYAFRSSQRKELNVRFGGSGDNGNYYSSLGYLKDIGYIVNSDFERATARLNLNQNVKKWLSTNMNIGYNYSTQNINGQESNSNSIFWFADNMPSIYPLFLRDDDGKIISDPIFGGNQYDYGANGRKFGSLTNAIADATYNIMRHKRHELNGNVGMDFKIMPGLTFETKFGGQYYYNNYVELSNKYYGSAASQNGSIYHSNTSLTNYNMLELLRYKKKFDLHNFEILAAHENAKWEQKIARAFKYNLVEPYNTDLRNAIVTDAASVYSFTDDYALESYFSQATYDYDAKYFLSASVRRDGSSRFLKDKWGTFGSVGAAWMISREQFMATQNIFTDLKLKASYGLIGDQAGVGYYPGYSLFSINNLNDKPSFPFNTKGNPDLTWETAQMFQTGIEFTIKNIITGSVDYYIKNTKDLIFDRRVGPSLGYALIRVNDGTLQNKGLEFDLSAKLINRAEAGLTLSVNGESFKNKITSMPIDPATGEQKPIDIQGSYGWAVDHSVYDYYMRDYVGVDPTTGTSTWKMYYDDKNGNGRFDGGEGIGSLNQYLSENDNVKLSDTITQTYASATQFYVGKSALPKLRGGINLNAFYKGIELGIQFLYSLGGYAYDGAYAQLMANDLIGSNNWHTDMFRRWQKPGDITDVPRLNNEEDPNVASLSSRYLTKADYLALNNVRLGYNLPKNLLGNIGIEDCNIWVSGDNLWLKTKRDGMNPSTAEAGGSDTYRYMPMSTISMGVRFKF